MIACLFFSVLGCGNRYRKLDAFQTGYKETALSYGNYVVSYRDTDLSFAKEAAFYRVAQFCLETGFRYFVIKDEQVFNRFGPNLHPVGDPSDGDPNFFADAPVSDSDGLVPKDNGAGYNYTVEYFKDNPGGASVRDAAKTLKSIAVPGTNSSTTRSLKSGS